MRSMPGRAVREAVLADFTDSHAVPAIDTLAWVVALTVPSQALRRPFTPGSSGGAVVHGGIYRCQDGGVHHGCRWRTAPAS